MKSCSNSRCTQYNRPIVAKGVRFCPSCGEPLQAPSKRRWLSVLMMLIGTVFVLLILFVVMNGLDGIPGMPPEPPTTTVCCALDPTPPPYWDNVYVEYILDASGSMQEELDSVRKIEIAKEVLGTKAGQLPTTTNVGLRVYGHRIDYQDDKEGSCRDIELMVPPVRGGRDRVLEKLPTLNALGMTPLSDSVIQSVDDFDYNDPFRHNSLVVISDGEETCGGDPCSMADDLINVHNISFTMYVIGFDILDNPTAQAQLQCLADKTGGVFLQANNRDELAQALDSIWDTMDQRVAADHEEQPPVAEADATGVCVVPDVVGQDVAVAESSLTGAGLQAVKDFRHDDSVAQNAIISQDLAAGTRLEPCQGDVVIVVSLGPTPPTESPLPPTAVPIPTPTPLIITTFTVPPQPQWADSGIELKAGDKVTIEYITGQWRSHSTHPIVGPEGNSAPQNQYDTFTLPIANSMSLIAQVGTSSPFLVGHKLDFEAPSGGTLLLGANDDIYDDNTGSITVRITVETP